MKQPAKKRIKNQDLGIIAVTFIIGLVAGWYLYVVAFAPQFNEYLGQTEAVYDDLVIEGDQYGGFRTGTPPGFQLLKDGSYTYVPFTAAGTVVEPKQGNLPRALLSEVKTLATRSNLSQWAKPEIASNCASMVDGIDYRYEIILNTVVYNLNTCGTALATDQVANDTLDKLWNYFETLP